MRRSEAVVKVLWLQLIAITLLCMPCLDAISAFDHVGFEGDWSWAAVEFEEETAGVAQDAAGFVASP